MIRNVQIEYGDFQTPLELAEKVCQKLVELGVSPNVIVEPTCGVGNFIEAAAHLFRSTNKIIGVEINQDYLQKIEKKNCRIIGLTYDMEIFFSLIGRCSVISMKKY